MPRRKRHGRKAGLVNVFSGLEASRRVGWARYYDERDHSARLQTLCDIYRDRIETLVPEFLVLIDSVLHEKNIDAFKRAYRVQTLIDAYEKGQRK